MRYAAASSRSPVGGSLTIAIPSLNKENAIGETISRCLRAKDRITRCQTNGLRAGGEAFRS
jgi:hypothetical protein